jgi:demethylmenaquinone methyltransferase/2-methoxy-6-polyprenyl-1,4-benzoquinol methylase
VNHEVDPKLLGRQPDEVARMFTEISPRYDLLNRVLSFGMDGSWRKTAVRFARPAQARHILDLASGTGDLSLAFAEAPGFSGDVLGIDFSEAMVQLAREKATARSLATRVQFREGDALATGEPDEAYDVVSIGFGLRNFNDPERGLRECLRVLAPGGRLVVVDFFSKDEILPVRFYLDHVLPLIGRVVSRSRSAYTYLRESKKGFWTPEELTHRLLATGFREVMTKPLTMGIAHCVVGVKRSGFS